MERAAQVVKSAMIAVMGLDREALAHACNEASGEGVVVIANYNCPGQLVIGGERAAVERAAQLAREAGARRCVPLAVIGPFHTPLMAPAGKALERRFAALPFQEMRIPVIFNCVGDGCRRSKACSRCSCAYTGEQRWDHARRASAYSEGGAL